jgi:hypothetical protein
MSVSQIAGLPEVWPGVHDSTPAGLPALRACRVLVLAPGPGEQPAGQPQVQCRRREQCRAPVVAAGPEDPRQHQQPDRHRDPYPGNRLWVTPGTRACEDSCAAGRVVRCCHLPHLPSTLCGKPSLLCRVKSSPGGVRIRVIGMPSDPGWLSAASIVTWARPADGSLLMSRSLRPCRADQRGEHAGMAAGRGPRYGQVHLREPWQAIQPHLAVAPHRARPLAGIPPPRHYHDPLIRMSAGGHKSAHSSAANREAE